MQKNLANDAIARKTELVKNNLQKLKKLSDPCRLCPRECMAKRSSGETGFCKADSKLKIAAWSSHKGEEPFISGQYGSGTIFASHCTLACCFCQNFPFSQLGNGLTMEPAELAEKLDQLSSKRIHNFNFVTPTHYIHLLLEAWLNSSVESRSLPLVYNCSGYESEKVLKLLDGIIDIYLPDIKYADNIQAKKYSKCPDYVEKNRKTLLLMHKQVGNLQIDKSGLAEKGLAIRHLVLPDRIADTERSLLWLKNNLGKGVCLSIMCQYFPTFKASDFPEINRPLSSKEYFEVLNLVDELCFTNVQAQDPDLAGGA
ncbi:MAG: radical SAM protein [Candidatus Rifleibacteriota bacterium]